MTETPTPHVLVVTSSGSPAAVVVPVLAALEASGMRVRAIDVGAAGGGGASVADRLRRAFLGESAERRLRKEIEINPPDVAVAFDPHAAAALAEARDHVGAASPVVAVVADLEPVAPWGAAAADRFCAIDNESAVALADLGIEAERVLVVGPVGPRAWADAGAEYRDVLRTRFKLVGQIALIEVAGMGAELTASLAMQLSLAELSDSTTYLFDAGHDAESAATLRSRVPVLGLRAKLFGATSADAPLLWRCADVVVARPRLETVAKATLVGARMVLLVDDAVPGGARTAAALEARKVAVIARSPMLIASALESVIKVRGGNGQADGADTIADLVWVVAGDRRAVVEERKAAERADVHDKVRAATSAAQQAAKVVAAPGELEDLGGGDAPVAAEAPDPGTLARLVAETQARKKEMERAMMAAREAADRWAKSGDTARAEAERARMHSLLGELGQLETELRDLERAVAAAPRTAPPPPASAPPTRASAPKAAPRPPAPTVDDELAALKRKMAQTPKKKP